MFKNKNIVDYSKIVFFCIVNYCYHLLIHKTIINYRKEGE